MKKAKVRGIAALFAALFALMLAAFLCMNVPVRDVRAADETETAETYDMTVEGNTATVSSWQDMLSAFTNSNVSIIKLGEDITFDFISDDALKTAMTTAGMPGYALYVTRDLELDLNGKTLRVVTDYISSAIVYYQSTGVDVTIRNGTLSGKSSENFIQVGTREDGSSTLTLEDVRIDFTNANGSSANTSSAILVSGGLDLNNVTFDVTNAKRVSVADGPVGTVTYATLQDAVNAADNGETVTLSGNVFEDIVVAEGQNITLDLNGFTLTNTAGQHTITNYGTLTIVGEGTVMNKGGGKAAVRNFGTAYLNGGTYTRSNSTYYIIKNVGHMTIGENAQSTVKVVSEDERSSLIANGYYGENDKNAHAGITVAPENACTMIINGGTFTGGMVTVKNDDEGVLTIYDGTFTNSYYEKGYSGSVITAAGNLVTINGGTFMQEESAAHGLRIAASGNVTTTVVVAGGTFTEGTDVYLMNGGVDDRGKPIPTGTLDVTIEDGVFNGTLNTENFNGKVLETDAIKITGGTFNADLALGSTMKVAISGGDYKSIPKSDYLDENVKMYQYTEDAGEKNDYFVIVGATEEKPANTEETGYIRVDNVGYANTLAEAFEMAAENKKSKIYLCADITESVTYTGGYMTIYLDGYTWTADGDQPALTNETTSSSGLRIRSSKGVDGGAIVRTTAGPVIVNEATLTLGSSSSSGKYTVKNESAGDYALIENSGRLTVTSGTFESAGTLFVNNGEKISVNGGTFDREVDAEFIANGYTCVDNGDGTYGIMKVVAQIVRGEETLDYTDWATAVNALQNGDTLVMLASVEGGLTIKEGLTVSLELRAGKLNGAIINYGNLTILGEGTGTVTDTITNGESAELTITGGTFENDLIADGQEITITGGTFKGGLTTSAGTGSTYIHHIAPYVDNENGYYLIDHTQAYSNKYTVGQGEAVALIEDGEFSMYAGSIAVAQGYLKMGAGTDVKVTLCANVESFTFNKNPQSLANNVTFDLNGKSIAGDITVNNGLAVTIIGNGTVEGTVKATEGTLSIQGGTFTVKPDESYLAAGMTVYEVDGKYLVGDQNAVAVVKETGTAYTSLQAAIDAAGEEDTIVLLANVDLSAGLTVTKKIALNGNGFTITGGITVQGTEADVTLTNVIFAGNDSSSPAIRVRGGATVVMNGGSISGYGDIGVYVGYRSDNAVSTFKAEGVTFRSIKSKGIYGEAIGDLAIVDCAFTDIGTAEIDTSLEVVARSTSAIDINQLFEGGTVTISESTFTNCGYEGGSTSGAVKIKVRDTEAEHAAGQANDITGNYKGSFDSVTLDGNTYSGCVRKIVLGTGYVAETCPDTITGSDLSVSGNVVDFSKVVDIESLNAALADGMSLIKLHDNIMGDVVIESDMEVTLDLNGCTITNVDDHTITNNGTLVIVDNAGDGSSANMIASNFDTIYNTGTLTVGKNVYVDALSHGEAAVYNEVGGTFTLDGGRLARSKENGISSSNNGGNSFYVLLNHGTATLNGIIQQPGGYSSLIENGWQDGNDNKQRKPSVMTIKGGEYSGGLNTVKNDDYGQLTITGGTFSNISQAAVMNWNVAEINGGTFEINEGAFAVVVNGYLNDTMDQGKLTITGGTFTGGTIIMQNSNATDIGEVAVSGGTFGEPVPEDYLDRNGTDNPLYALQYDSKTDAYTLVENSEPQAMIIDASGVSYRYATLVNALEAAQNGDTVVLLGDVNLTEALTIDKNVTIDLAGHTVSAEGTAANITADVTIESSEDGGAIVYTGGGADHGLVVTKNATLTIEGVDVDYDNGGQAIRLGDYNGGIPTADGGNAVLTNAIVTGGVAGVAMFGTAEGSANKTSLTATDSSISGTVYYGIATNGTFYNNVISLTDTNVSAPKATGTAMYLPGSGETTITGGEIKGATGIEIRAGKLTVNEGTTVTATGVYTEPVPNPDGTTVGGVAIAVSQHTTERPIDVTVNGGTINATGADGKAFLEIDTVGKEDVTPSERVAISIVGGKFNAPVEARNITGFISGGQYAELPAEGLFAEGYEGAFYGATGYYEVIESVSDDLAALLTAQANAQADVRGALAAYGWTMAYVEQLAAQEGEASLKANAAALVAAYADITAATSEYGVAQARLAAINALDGLLAEFDDMKTAAAGEIATAAEAKEEADGQPAQEAVVVPTATYNAIYAARNKAELESLLENALAEIADIRSYRAQIAAQSTQLGEIEKAVGELNSGLFTDNTGAIDSILNTIEAAREQITGVTADADAASLAELNEYLTETIKGSLDTINTLLNAFAKKLLGAYNEADGTFAGNGTLDTLLGYFEGNSDIFDAITQAKNEIMGIVDGEGGMSISDLSDSLAKVIAAFEENGTIDSLQNDLTAVKEALLGTSGIDDRIDSILKKIDSVIGTNGTTLDSILSAVSNANTAIGEVKTLLDSWSSSIGLLGSMNTTLTNAAADIGDLTGALLDASGELSSSITEAIADIESIRQSIASLADGDDVTAITGDLTDILADIAALQTAVDSIANSVSASTAVEEAKDNAMTDLRDWLNDYLDSLLGADSAQAGILVARAAYTPETTDGDIYARLTQAFSEDNANLVLRYYNEALAAIDAATTISDVTTAVSTFRAQVASVEASAQNTPSLTGVYVLLAVVLVLIVVACIVMLLKGRREVAAQTQAQPETQPETQPAAQLEETPAEAAEEPAAPAEEPAAPAAPAEELAAEEDGDKEHIVIAANVRSFSEAYMDLTDEQRDLFNKVREYALAKEGAVEVKQSGGVVVKREGKQVVKLTVRRDMPVALFLLENEMLKTFRRNAKSEAKLKVRATELVIRDEDDLETAYTMVDLSVDQIEKDIEAAKERRKELRRQRRLERQAQQAAAQAESAAAQAPADGTAAETPAPDAGEGSEE